MSDETNFEDARLASDERRRNNRQRLIIDVFFDGTDATGVASTQDISTGGLYMNTQTPLPEGAHLMLRLPFAERDCVLAGEVVYANEGRGVGVKFKNVSDADRALIERALAELSK
jgi:Tfp pilus assembly protein PilZ